MDLADWTPDPIEWDNLWDEGMLRSWWGLIYSEPTHPCIRVFLRGHGFFQSANEERDAYLDYGRKRLTETGVIWQVAPSKHLSLQIERHGDRYFRNAWVSHPGSYAHHVGGITLDLEKARDRFRDHIRRIAAPLIAAIDDELENPTPETDAAALKTRRGELHDLPWDTRIKSATTGQALIDLWPATLLGEHDPLS